MKSVLLALALLVPFAKASPAPSDLPHTDTPEATATAYLTELFRDSRAAMQYLYIDNKRLALDRKKREPVSTGGWGTTPSPYPLFTLPDFPPNGSAASAQTLRDSYARALSPYLCSASKQTYCFEPDNIAVHHVVPNPDNGKSWFDDRHLQKTAVQTVITGRVNGEVETPRTVVWLTPTEQGWRVLGHETIYWSGDKW